MIIKHPLDQCVNVGSLDDLDSQGRLSLDLIMTMIGDMRFRADRIEGTCARYFLLVDLSVLRSLCASAHLDCDKVRHYIRRFDTTDTQESGPSPDVPQADFHFPIENNEPSSGQEFLSRTRLDSDPQAEQTARLIEAGCPSPLHGWQRMLIFDFSEFVPRSATLLRLAGFFRLSTINPEP